MTTSTIICDIDGVLIWHHPHDPLKDWRRKLALSDTLFIWEAFQHSPDWQFCLRNAEIDPRVRFKNFLIHNDLTIHADSNTVIDIWLNENYAPCEPAIRRLKKWQEEGYRCVIATNQDGLRKSYIEKWLIENGLGEMPRFISCDLKTAKPDAAFYNCIENELRQRPGDMLLLDDSKKNIAAATKAGWNALWVDDSFKLNPAKWNSLTLFDIAELIGY